MSRVTAQADAVFDVRATTAAERVARRAIDDVLAGGRGPRGVVVTAPAGAGKSYLVAAAVARARARGARVAAAAPTNEQAFGLVRKIAQVYGGGKPGRGVGFLPASTVSLPDEVRALPGVLEVDSRGANGAALVVGTLSKLGDAFSRGSLGPFDLLLIDEAYQADSSKYFAGGDLAPVHLLVGDGG